MSDRDVLVDPAQMLVVRYDDPRSGLQDLLVVACRYLPAVDPSGGRRVAVEVVLDPAEPTPRAPYYCPRRRLTRQLLAPARVRTVRPYVR